jgi:hypothetical protein
LWNVITYAKPVNDLDPAIHWLSELGITEPNRLRRHHANILLLAYTQTIRRIAIAVLAAGAALGQHQISDEAIEKAKQVTVMINVDGTRPGAGIIFGLANGQVYIATANHLVRRGVTQASDI